MRKKSIITILAAAMLITACGSTGDPGATTNQTDTLNEAVVEEASTNESSVEVEEELFDVKITIPADLADGSTQEELDEMCKTLGYKSITLNSDGSITYEMTKKQHKQMLEDIAAEIRSNLLNMVGSEDYPNITDITVNDSFTEYTITTKSTELSIEESLSGFVFTIYSAMYSAFSGEDIDNVHVEFINADTGEVISSSDSSDMGN